jgi:AraC-like DNA-binding protein
LRDGASVTATCYAVGFGSLSHFVHAFHAAKGMTPSQFRSNASMRSRITKIRARRTRLPVPWTT